MDGWDYPKYHQIPPNTTKDHQKPQNITKHNQILQVPPNTNPHCTTLFNSSILYYIVYIYDEEIELYPYRSDSRHTLHAQIPTHFQPFPQAPAPHSLPKRPS